jgi:AcrR family transcriptional regulator
MPPRHRTASDLLKEQILTAALELLHEEGSGALTVRGIAKRASVAPMGVYNHFDGKSGVIDAIWIDGFAKLRDEMRAALAVSDPIEAIVDSGHRYRRFALANRSHYQVMFMQRFPDHLPSDLAVETASEAHQALVQLVTRAKESGAIAIGDPTDAAQGYWAAVHGYVSLEILDINFAGDANGTFDRLLSALVRGSRGR